MRNIQCLFAVVIMVCVSGSRSSLARKEELHLILGNIQNKLGVIANANSVATAQISTNAGALTNIQTQLNQVIAQNTATKTANDAANAKLSQLILAISSFYSAVGALYTANNILGVGTAYQTLATAVQGI